MRIIMIPGLGEDERIFDPILPFIEGDKTVLNTWTIIGDSPRGKTTAYEVAAEFVQTYNITKSDLLIGHSLGGLIAWCVKNIVGCTIIQISSYTDHKRIIVPIKSHGVIKVAIRLRLFFNDRVRKLIVKLHYENQPSKGIVIETFNMLKDGNKNNVINQLTAALVPLNKELSAMPDLRIHSKKDRIVRPPKEAYVEVPGDHFNLATHPAEVARPINEFLAVLRNRSVPTEVPTGTT